MRTHEYKFAFGNLAGYSLFSKTGSSTAGHSSVKIRFGHAWSYATQAKWTEISVLFILTGNTRLIGNVKGLVARFGADDVALTHMRAHLASLHIR